MHSRLVCWERYAENFIGKHNSNRIAVGRNITLQSRHAKAGKSLLIKICFLYNEGVWNSVEKNVYSGSLCMPNLIYITRRYACNHSFVMHHNCNASRKNFWIAWRQQLAIFGHFCSSSEVIYTPVSCSQLILGFIIHRPLSLPLFVDMQDSISLISLLCKYNTASLVKVARVVTVRVMLPTFHDGFINRW